jgi:hypothetical protein
MVCVNDLFVDARQNDGSKPGLSYEDVMSTLKSINWHHSPIAVSKHLNLR